MHRLFVACVGALLFLSSCQRIPPTSEQGTQGPGPSSLEQNQVGATPPEATATEGERPQAEKPRPPALSAKQTRELDLSICQQALDDVRAEIANASTTGAQRQAALLAALDELFRASVELAASLPSLQARQTIERALAALKDGKMEEAGAAAAALQEVLPELTWGEPVAEAQKSLTAALGAIAGQRASEAEAALRNLLRAVQARPAEQAALEMPKFVEAASGALRLDAGDVAAANVGQVERRLQALAKEWGLAEQPAEQAKQ